MDVRIVTATHQNLEALIRQGRFREDLFYRLNVFPISVPPLREPTRRYSRSSPVFFVQQSAQRRRGARRCTSTTTQLAACSRRQSWPGNIRQLENSIERAVVVAESETLTLQDLPADLNSSNIDDLLAVGGSFQPVGVEVAVPASSFRNETRCQRARAIVAGN